MRGKRGAFLALGVLGGYFAWRNRSAIQRQLESLGIRAPLTRGDLREVGGKTEQFQKKASTY